MLAHRGKNQQPKKNSGKLFLLFLLVLFFLALTLFTSTTKPKEKEKRQDSPRSTGRLLSQNAPGERAVFDIIAENDSFSPTRLSAYKGQIIVIYLSAEDKTYDLTLPDLGISKEIKKDSKEAVEFQATNIGDFPFFCKNCPEASSARGVLTIKP